MTEEVAQVAQPEVTATAPTPVEAAPVVAPVEVAPSATEAAPVVTEATVPEPAPLLAPVEEVAPVQAEVKTEEIAPETTESAVLPVYEFKLPEGLDAESSQFKTFQTKLGELQNLSKAEQVIVQKFGQEMIEMHVQQLKEFAETNNKASWDWFKSRNAEWLEKAKADPVIGGEGWDGTVSAAQQAISLYGGSKAQQVETAKLLQETGVENHPAILRFLSNITKVAAKEGQPVSSQSVPVQKQGIASAMYGTTSK